MFDISIHAPREGGDGYRGIPEIVRGISIHAPREGGDVPLPRRSVPLCHFNPRPPRGGRPVDKAAALVEARFQSTPPARGATA